MFQASKSTQSMPRAQSTQSPYKPRKQMQRMGPEDDLGVEGVGEGPDEEGGGEAAQLEQAPHVRHLRPDTNACWRFGDVLRTASVHSGHSVCIQPLKWVCV